MPSTLLLAAIVVASAAGWILVIRQVVRRRRLPRAEMCSHDGLPPTANEIKGFSKQAQATNDVTPAADPPGMPGGGD